jgi:hypothetical protein
MTKKQQSISKLLDDEMRKRIDKLGICNRLMTLEDAKRLPKSFKYETIKSKKHPKL